MVNSLIIPTRKSSGLLSNFLIVVDNLKYCKDNNLKPIVDWSGKGWYYYNGTNLWNLYFEPLNDGIVIGEDLNPIAKKIGHYIKYRHNPFFLLWDDEKPFICNPDGVPIWKYSLDKGK